MAPRTSSERIAVLQGNTRRAIPTQSSQPYAELQHEEQKREQMREPVSCV